MFAVPVAVGVGPSDIPKGAWLVALSWRYCVHLYSLSENRSLTHIKPLLASRVLGACSGS